MPPRLNLILTTLALVAAPSCRTPDSGGRLVDKLDSRVWCLHERENGELWFGTNGAGVFRRRGEQLIQYTSEHGLTGNHVRQVVSDGAGGVLVTANGGVARFDGESFTPLEVVQHSGKQGWRLHPDDVWLAVDAGAGQVCRFDGQKLHQLELTESKAGGPPRPEDAPEWYDPAGVYKVAKDRRGHVWVGTAGAGLCRYDGTSIDWMYETRLTTTPRGGEFGIRSIFQDRRGDYWICNTRQRFEIEVGALNELLNYSQKKGLPASETNGSVNFTYFPSIVEDAAGTLWMACGSDGILRYDGESVQRYTLGEDSYAISILIDRSGTVWVGTLEHGALRFHEGGFQSFGDSQGR